MNIYSEKKVFPHDLVNHGAQSSVQGDKFSGVIGSCPTCFTLDHYKKVTNSTRPRGHLVPQEVPLENFCLQSSPLLSSFHWLPVNPFHTIWFVNVNLLQVFFFRCRTYIQRLSLMKQALDIYFPQKTILLFATYNLYNKLNCLVLLVVYHLGSCVCFFFFLKFCWQSCVFNF